MFSFFSSSISPELLNNIYLYVGVFGCEHTAYNLCIGIMYNVCRCQLFGILVGHKACHAIDMLLSSCDFSIHLCRMVTLIYLVLAL